MGFGTCRAGRAAGRGRQDSSEPAGSLSVREQGWNHGGQKRRWKSHCLPCCREDNALLGTEPCEGDGSDPPASHPASGHGSLPSMGQGPTCPCGSLIRPPSSPAGINGNGFLPSPGCHCVPTFDQESAFLKCSISHMLR